MFGLIFQREVYGLFKIFFLLRVAKKAVLKKEESQKCHLAFKNEEKDGLSWHYLCQLHILRRCISKMEWQPGALAASGPLIFFYLSCLSGLMVFVS